MANRKSTHDWHIEMPLSDLLKIKEQLDTIEYLKKDHERLRQEMNGLRNLYSALLIRVDELKQDLW